MTQTSTQTNSKVMVALDFPTSERALQFVKQLEASDQEVGSVNQLEHFEKPWLKVGMQLYYAAGPAFIAELKERGYSIFLDLKLHDIPNTVKGAAQSIAQLGVDMFNVHCAGGRRMMEAALEGVYQSSASPLVIGVTQLTSTSQEIMNQEIGIAGAVEESVLHYATLAQQSGLHGVVCSPLEVNMIKARVGKEFLTVTPGIRLTKETQDDQVRIMTHVEAQSEGADYLVVGRAITQAHTPTKVYQQIMKELVGA